MPNWDRGGQGGTGATHNEGIWDVKLFLGSNNKINETNLNTTEYLNPPSNWLE